MDFVVAGLGIGALVVVIGFAIRDLGPLAFRASGFSSPARLALARSSWRRLCHDVSNALAAGGAIVVVATIVAVLAGVSDGTGGTVVLISAFVGVATAIALAFIGLQRYRTPDVAGDNMIARGGISSLQSDLTETSEERGAPRVRKLPRVVKPEPMAAANEAETPDDAFEVAMSDVPVGHEPIVLTAETEETAPETSAAFAAARSGQEAPTKSDAPSPESDPLDLPDWRSPVPAFQPMPVAPMTSGGVFTSSLLADIGLPQAEDAPSSGFTSKLFEDVSSADLPDSDQYHSALLAEAATGDGSGLPTAPVLNPVAAPIPVESEPTPEATVTEPATSTPAADPLATPAEDVHYEDIVTAEMPAPTNRATHG